MPGATAIHDLPYLTWLGVKLYASNVRTSWGFRLAPREYPYIAGEGHDNVGRQSIKSSATIHFNNNIEPGMYPGKFNNVRGMLLKGQSGDLKHPDIGKIYSRIVSVSYELSPSRAAGVAVDVEWTESIKAASAETQFQTSSASATASAQQADEAIASLGLDYPDGMGSTTFVGLVNDILSQGSLFAFKIGGIINKAVGYVDSMHAQIQATAKAAQYAEASIKDAIAAPPARWLLEHALNALHVQLKDIEKAAAGARAIKTYSMPTTASLATVSLDLGSDIGDLIDLNPALVTKPVVSKGTLIRYFAEA